MREKYESLSLATLKDLAKARGLRGISTLRKPELIERMLQEDEKEQNTQNTAPQPEKENIRTEQPENKIREVRKPAETLVRSENHVIRNNERRTYQERTQEKSRERYQERNTDIRIGLKRVLRQIQHSWTAERKLTVFWKYCLTDMDLSAVPIIFREKMIFTFHLHRSAALT